MPAVEAAALALISKALGYGSVGSAGVAVWKMLHRANRPTPYDLYQHVTIMGGTGSGKTNLMKWKARQLFDEGWSVWWFSIQRRSADELLSSLSYRDLDRVTWMCPDEPAPLTLNLLACTRNTPEEWALIAEQTMAIFQQQDSAWGQNIAEALGNAVYAVLEWAAKEGTVPTLWDAVRLLCEDTYRAQVVARTSQPAVRQFFATVFPTMQSSVIRAAARILRLLRNNHLLRVLSAPDSLSVTDLMSEPGLRFVVADQHGLGSTAASALYLSILLSKIEAVAYSRGAWSTPCALFLDEFHLYATSAVGNLLEQGRRHNMSLWLACQGTWQNPVAETSAWQTGTWHIFRPQAMKDAAKMARAVSRDESELTALPNCVSISRQLIRGKAQQPERFEWPIYSNGSGERLRELKAELLRRRGHGHEQVTPEVKLPLVPWIAAPRTSVVPPGDHTDAPQKSPDLGLGNKGAPTPSSVMAPVRRRAPRTRL